MKKNGIGWLLIFIMIGSVSAFAAVKKGAENMTLPGGNRGPVPFPHARHQSALTDCNLCHTHFPQQAGIIQTLKDEGKLKKKQIMKRCTACHRERAKTGQRSGPIRCKTCHQQ